MLKVVTCQCHRIIEYCGLWHVVKYCILIWWNKTPKAFGVFLVSVTVLSMHMQLPTNCWCAASEKYQKYL